MEGLWEENEIRAIMTEVQSRKSVDTLKLFGGPHGTLPEILARRTPAEVKERIDRVKCSFDSEIAPWAPKCGVPELLAVLASEAAFCRSQRVRRTRAVEQLEQDKKERVKLDLSRRKLRRERQDILAQLKIETALREKFENERESLQRQLDIAKARVDAEVAKRDALEETLDQLKIKEMDARRRLDRARLKVAASRGCMVSTTMDGLVHPKFKPAEDYTLYDLKDLAGHGLQVDNKEDKPQEDPVGEHEGPGCPVTSSPLKQVSATSCGASLAGQEGIIMGDENPNTAESDPGDRMSDRVNVKSSKDDVRDLEPVAQQNNEGKSAVAVTRKTSKMDTRSRNASKNSNANSSPSAVKLPNLKRNLATTPTLNGNDGVHNIKEHAGGCDEQSDGRWSSCTMLDEERVEEAAEMELRILHNRLAMHMSEAADWRESAEAESLKLRLVTFAKGRLEEEASRLGIPQMPSTNGENCLDGLATPSAAGKWAGSGVVGKDRSIVGLKVRPKRSGAALSPGPATSPAPKRRKGIARRWFIDR